MMGQYRLRIKPDANHGARYWVEKLGVKSKHSPINEQFSIEKTD
jgi:hypothetical protein